MDGWNDEGRKSEGRRLEGRLPAFVVAALSPSALNSCLPGSSAKPAPAYSSRSVIVEKSIEKPRVCARRSWPMFPTQQVPPRMPIRDLPDLLALPVEFAAEVR